MGCDIHIFVERMVKDKWIMVEELRDNARERNYERFARLAGVRGDGPKPKGLPIDVSESVTLHVNDWGRDAHSFSHMSAEEAAEIFSETGCGEDNPLSYYFNIERDVCPCCHREVYNKHRVVFFFDN